MPLSLFLFPYDVLYKRFKGLFLLCRTFIRFLYFSGSERTEKVIKQKESNVKRYSLKNDTIKEFKQFNLIRKATLYHCFLLFGFKVTDCDIIVSN